MLRRRASETLSYQREVDKGKLTVVASFEKLTFRAGALCWSKVEDYGLRVCMFIYWVRSYVIGGIIATEDE